MFKNSIMPYSDEPIHKRSFKKTLLLSKKELAVLKKVLHPRRLFDISDLVDAAEIKVLFKLADKIEKL